MSQLPLLITIIASFIGIFDAGYINYEEFTGKTPPCINHAWFDCGAVLNSQWSHIGPIPLALLGLGFYIFMFFLSTYLFVRTEASIWLKRVHLLAAVSAFIFSIFLVYLQVGVIGALCLFCMISATTSTIIFLSTAANWMVNKHDQTAL